MENLDSLPKKVSKKNEGDQRLFSSVKYYLSGIIREEVIKALTDCGAERLNYFSDYVTHCILGENYSDSDVSYARDLFEVPAIMQEWVSVSIYCDKILPIKAFQAPDLCLLSGISVCLSQVSRSDSTALWALITFYGGICSLQLNKKTTHLITTKTNGGKYEYAVNKTTVKIVSPDWLTDSIQNKTLCNESLYHPRLLVFTKVSSPSSTAHITGFEDIDSSFQLSVKNNRDLEQLKQRLPWNQSPSNNAMPTELQSPLQNQATSQILINMMQQPSPIQSSTSPLGPVLSSPATPHIAPLIPMDVDINSPLIHQRLNLQKQQQQIQQKQLQQQEHQLQLQWQKKQPQQFSLVANSKTETTLANMLSIRVQNNVSTPNQDNVTESQQRTILNNVTNSPAQNIGPVLGASGERIINAVKSPLTNSANRVAAALAKCAAEQVNSQNVVNQAQFYGHIPTAKIPPDKCLLGCVFFVVEYDKHPIFCKEVPKWKKIISENGGEVESSYSFRLTHILCQTQKHPLVQQGLREGKRCVTADWLSDIIQKQQLLHPFYALHLPVPFSDERPCRHLIMSITGFKGEKRNRVKNMIELTGAKVTTYFSSDNHFLICHRPEGKKVKKARECGKPVVNVQWLNEILFGHYNCIHESDLQKYQHYNNSNPFKIDYTYIMHLMGPWKIPVPIPPEFLGKALPNFSSKVNRRKRSRPSSSDIISMGEENVTVSLNDVQIINSNPPAIESRPVILLTGFVNSVGEKLMVKQLGGELAKSCRDATHLVMNKPVRTFKLLCCLSTSKHIVSVDWLKDSLKQSRFLDEAPYTIEEVEIEGSTEKCNIAKILQMKDRNQLFKGKIFYITPGVIPANAALREIIECAGGKVEKQRRSFKVVQEMEPRTYFPITCSDDLHIVADLIQNDCGAYNAEFVLTAVMTQTLHYETVFKKKKSCFDP